MGRGLYPKREKGQVYLYVRTNSAEVNSMPVSNVPGLNS